MMPSPQQGSLGGGGGGFTGGSSSVTPGAPPSVPSSTAGATAVESEEKVRFQVELEFVQCLGNPNYLNFLAQRGYFKDPAMINYLSYLRYWSQPEYVKFIKFPVCLHFLELLQHEAFRKEIANGACAKFLDDQTILHWQSYTRKRMRLVEGAVNAGAASGAATPASAIQGSNQAPPVSGAASNK